MRPRLLTVPSVVVAAVVLAGVATACRPVPGSVRPPRQPWSRAVLPVGPLRAEGRWIKDATGRTVIVHGLQLAHKSWPYLPTNSGFGEQDAANIARWGFNAVRLSWFWKGLEPERGRVDRNYVARLDRIGDQLASRGVFTLLEAHQDGYNERLGGAGFPDWATIGEVPPGANGLLGEPSWEAFENLYSNTDGIGSAFERAWVTMAAAFRDNPAMLGYDLINEPGAGSASLECLIAANGCPAFDRGILQRFEEGVARAVRSVDARTITFLEPNIFHDVGAPSSLGITVPATGPSAFAFHVYCLNRFINPLPDRESEAPGYESCTDHDGRNIRNGAATAARMGVPPLLGEFGDTDDLADVERMLDLADENLMGWIYWGYKDWDDNPGGQGSGPLFEDSENVGTLRRDKLAVLSRPFAAATAGTPLSSRFDRPARTFRYSFVPDRTISAPTAMYTSPVNYPDGYRAEVDGAWIVSAPNAPYLQLRTRPEAEVVKVRLLPRQSRSTAKTPRDSLGSRPMERPAVDEPAESFSVDRSTSGTCAPNPGSPLILELETGRPEDGPATVRVSSARAAGTLSGPGVRPVAFAPGDVTWVTVDTSRSSGSAQLHLLCRSGGRFEVAVGRGTSLPLRRSGRSSRLPNVSLAASRLGFPVARTGRYVADVDPGGGSLLVGLRRPDGSSPAAIRVSTPVTVDLGRLRAGNASLDVVALPGSGTDWTATIRLDRGGRSVEVTGGGGGR